MNYDLLRIESLLREAKKNRDRAAVLRMQAEVLEVDADIMEREAKRLEQRLGVAAVQQ